MVETWNLAACGSKIVVLNEFIFCNEKKHIILFPHQNSWANPKWFVLLLLGGVEASKTIISVEIYFPLCTNHLGTFKKHNVFSNTDAGLLVNCHWPVWYPNPDSVRMNSTWQHQIFHLTVWNLLGQNSWLQPARLLWQQKGELSCHTWYQLS